jgi:hypothetical protein
MAEFGNVLVPGSAQSCPLSPMGSLAGNVDWLIRTKMRPSAGINFGKA